MLDLDWYVAILSALSAFVVLLIAHRMKEVRRAQRELATARAEAAKLQAMDLMRRDAELDVPPELETPPETAYFTVLDRTAIGVLILAILWSGGLIWMRYYALADATDNYQHSARANDAVGACRYAKRAVELLHEMEDQDSYLSWLETERKACQK